MADTIPGGAYQGTDGEWHDAEGKPLSKEQIAAAQALQAKAKAEADAAAKANKAQS